MSRPMKASEMIEELQAIIAEVGDVDLLSADDSGYISDVAVGYGRPTYGIDEPPAPDVALFYLGDLASDAERYYEEMMDRR